MTTVILKQINRYGWQLLSDTGKLLVDDLSFPNEYKAECWVKAYISTWQAWNYKLEPRDGK